MRQRKLKSQLAGCTNAQRRVSDDSNRLARNAVAACWQRVLIGCHASPSRISSRMRGSNASNEQAAQCTACMQYVRYADKHALRSVCAMCAMRTPCTSWHAAAVGRQRATRGLAARAKPGGCTRGMHPSGRGRAVPRACRLDQHALKTKIFLAPIPT